MILDFFVVGFFSPQRGSFSSSEKMRTKKSVHDENASTNSIGMGEEIYDFPFYLKETSFDKKSHYTHLKFSPSNFYQVAAVGSFPSVIGQQLALSQSAVRGGGSAAEL